MVDDAASLDSYLAALVATELIRERPNEFEKEYIFKHVLIQEAAYSGLLLQQRRIYHKQIADQLAQLYWLRGEEYASTAAHHYEQGEVWNRALTYLIRSAEAAKSSFDIVSAVNFYGRALAIAEKVAHLDLKILIEIHEGRGNLLKRLGRIDEARADFEKVLQLSERVDHAVLQMRALSELGKLQDGYQDYDQAARYFERALEIARVVDDKSGIVDTLNELGDFHLNMGQLAQTEAYLNEAQTIAVALGNKRRLANSQNGLAAVNLYRGEIKASIEQLEELVQTWRNLGDYQGLMHAYIPLATAYTYQASYLYSDQTCQDALEILARFGDTTWVPQFRFYLAYNAFARGDMSATAANIAETIKIAKKVGKGIWHAAGLAYSGYYHLRQGQVETAWYEIEEAVQMAEMVGSPLWIGRVKRVQGAALLAFGKTAEAEAALASAYQIVRELGFVPDQVMALADLLAVRRAAGQWEPLRSQANHLMALALKSGMGAYQAQALAISAQAAAQDHDHDLAVDLLSQALEIVQRTQDRLIEHEIKTNLATVYLHQDRPDRAKASLADAEQLLTRIAGTIPDDQRRRDFMTIYRHSPLHNLEDRL